MLSDDNAGSSRRSTVAGGDSDHQGGPAPSNLSVDPSKICGLAVIIPYLLLATTILYTRQLQKVATHHRTQYLKLMPKFDDF